MTKSEELNALADRCERGEPSRELDACIREVHTGDKDRNKADPSARKRGWILVYRPDIDDLDWDVAPAYTTSLDAAVTLVPEGCVWGLNDFSGGTARIIGGDVDNAWEVYSDAGTTQSPALALCAAALRARASLTEE